jgi:hypothetical protein
MDIVGTVFIFELDCGHREQDSDTLFCERINQHSDSIN